MVSASTDIRPLRVLWLQGRLTGQKPPLKLKDVWVISVRLQLLSRVWDQAMFSLVIGSKVRAFDLKASDRQRRRSRSPRLAPNKTGPVGELPYTKSRY